MLRATVVSLLVRCRWIAMAISGKCCSPLRNKGEGVARIRQFMSGEQLERWGTPESYCEPSAKGDAMKVQLHLNGIDRSGWRRVLLNERNKYKRLKGTYGLDWEGRAQSAYKGDRMIEQPADPQKGKKPAKTRVQRLAEKIAKTSTGASVVPVKVAATLQGPAAASWKALQDAKGDLVLDEAGLLGLLLESGSSTVRQALKAAAKG